MTRFLVLLLLVVSIASVTRVLGSDPELTTDFFVPPNVNVSTIDGNFFTFTGFCGGVSPAPKPGQFGVSKAFSNVFTALTGLGVSTALLEFNSISINAPHIHPRASEILVVLSGRLSVGFVDSNNKLFEQLLQTGDAFVFPKGLVHFQVNLDEGCTATALAAFSSSNPGLIMLRDNLFHSDIPSRVLEEAFGVGKHVIHKLEKSAKKHKKQY